ncbi:SDR family NAD(P)-dependent oxidoreductase [Streptomyces sp. NPDC020490]|uniref:SDR family NAD(P)-dependent oxidoreductase n=1 Tax=Streptomyces sp. NPDC020490 TaxID=3365078 RepID=UPI0037A06009
MTTSATQAVVIGAGPGLGRSLALTYARNGLDVGLVARDAERLQQLADEIRQLGRTVTVETADAADPSSIASAVEKLSARTPISLLSYNAAMWGPKLSEVGLDTLRSAGEVNLHSAVAAVQAALPDLRTHHGTVLLTGGGLALHPSGDHGVLSVGKAAVRAAAYALAEDLAPVGVTVRTVTIAGFIAPGTDFDPDRIAEAFWDLAAHPGSEVERVYTGSQQ